MQLPTYFTHLKEELHEISSDQVVITVSRSNLEQLLNSYEHLYKSFLKEKEDKL